MSVKGKIAFFNSNINNNKKENCQKINQNDKNSFSVNNNTKNKSINETQKNKDRIQEEKSSKFPNYLNNNLKNFTSNKKDSNNNHEGFKIGKLINGKHPIYGSKKIEENSDDDNTLYIYDYPLNIEYSSNEETISILFIGQSGSGKSTFINAYVNHLLGITSDDNIRYKLILGDARKENDQTQSQTDSITVYNVRSLKYNNKLFKLIDTPGAGDTRNDNEQESSNINKDKKEKEFLEMYNKLFSQEMYQLNSIVFVVKSSENRKNEFQKKIIKNITNLFAHDIGENCLSILTHTDSDSIKPDAVKLIENIDIFKEKSLKNEEWYFPVSSPSYFIPFKKGENSITEARFAFTENSLISFTKKISSLKAYYIKATKKNIELKNKQENIIKILRDNILVNLLNHTKKLKNLEINLNKKIEECGKQDEKIEKIKNQVKQEEDLKNIIQKNLEIHKNTKQQKEQDLKKNIDNIDSLNKKKIDLEKKIGELALNLKKAEQEKIEAEKQKNAFQKDINELQTKIDNNHKELNLKKDEIIETARMREIKLLHDKNIGKLNILNKEIRSIEENMNKVQIENLREKIKQKEQLIQNKNEEIDELETENMKNLQKEIRELNQCYENLNDNIKKIEEEKVLKINRLKQKRCFLSGKIKGVENEIDKVSSNFEKQIKDKIELNHKNGKQINNVNYEIEKMEKIKKELEEKIILSEESRRYYLEKAENCKMTEKCLSEKIEDQIMKLNKQLEENKQIIGSIKFRELDFKNKQNYEIFNFIKNKIKNKINDKEKEKQEKIEYTIVKKEENDSNNLICNSCKSNCHLNCDCNWGLFWNPIWACKSIENGICKICNHVKDEHEKSKNYYKTIKKEKLLSPSKKRIIDSDINILLNNLYEVERKHDKINNLFKERIDLLNYSSNNNLKYEKELENLNEIKISLVNNKEEIEY